MFMVAITQPPFTHTTFSFLIFDSIDYRKTPLYRLMLKVIDFSWFFSFLALSFLGFFCLLVSFVLELLFFLVLFLLLYCNYNQKKRTTITNNNVSERERTPKTPTVVVTIGFCKPNLLISFTCMLNTC